MLSTLKKITKQYHYAIHKIIAGFIKYNNSWHTDRMLQKLGASLKVYDEYLLWILSQLRGNISLLALSTSMNMVAVVNAPILHASLPPASTHTPVMRFSPEHLLGSFHPRQQSGRRGEQILAPVQQAGRPGLCSSTTGQLCSLLLALITGSGLTHSGRFRAECLLGPDSRKRVNRPRGNLLLRFLGLPRLCSKSAWNFGRFLSFQSILTFKEMVYIY